GCLVRFLEGSFASGFCVGRGAPVGSVLRLAGALAMPMLLRCSMSQSSIRWYRVLAALTCCYPGLALAQTEAGQGEAPAVEGSSAEPARKMDLSTPRPPPPRTRKARVHNGFYLRGSFGAGGLWPSLLDRSDTDERFDVNGGTFALSFEIGRASCRERVSVAAVVGSVDRKEGKPGAQSTHL